MERSALIENASLGWKPRARPLYQDRLDQTAGIEPATRKLTASHSTDELRLNGQGRRTCTLTACFQRKTATITPFPATSNFSYVVAGLG